MENCLGNVISKLAYWELYDASK